MEVVSSRLWVCRVCGWQNVISNGNEVLSKDSYVCMSIPYCKQCRSRKGLHSYNGYNFRYSLDSSVLTSKYIAYNPTSGQIVGVDVDAIMQAIDNSITDLAYLRMIEEITECQMVDIV